MKAQTIERDHRSLAASVREGLNNGGSLEPLEGTPGDSKVAELYIFLPTAFLPFPIPSIHFFPPWRHACLIPDPFITRRKRPPTEVSSHRWPRTWGCPPPFFPFLSFSFLFPVRNFVKNFGTSAIVSSKRTISFSTSESGLFSFLEKEFSFCQRDSNRYRFMPRTRKPR